MPLHRTLLVALGLGLWAAAGVAGVGNAVGNPGLRWWYAGAAAAAIVLASARSAWAATGRWTGVAVAGSAAALTLVQAGPPVRYQHVADWSQLAEHPWALGVLAAQAVAIGVGWASGGRLARLTGGVRTAFGGGRLAG
jgi:hypothetical protein